MVSFADTLAQYDYSLPRDRIAQAPASPRDSAKLLVFDRKKNDVCWSTVRSLPQFLPQGSVLVLNETKVIPARLHLVRETGGKVAVLWLRTEGKNVVVLANRRLKEGEFLSMKRRTGFTVMMCVGKEWILCPSFPIARMASVLMKNGSMPLPPYIKHSPLTEAELRTRYQTVFAKNAGSIAAPTASLHFTPRLLKEIQNAGITIARVTLHVHLGTFAPLTEEQWKTGKLHEEFYSIDAKTARLLTEAKKQGRPIIAAGTTVARTLESASDARGKIIRPRGSTRLFIRDDYHFRMIDGLLTNFHVPRSSLLMLVSALTGRERLLDLYGQAIQHDFRFFSFGDAMVIL